MFSGAHLWHCRGAPVSMRTTARHEVGPPLTEHGCEKQLMPRCLRTGARYNYPMNIHAPRTDLIGIGLYTVGDAAHLLKAQARTVRRWMEGYEYRRKGESHRVAPLWEPDLTHSEGGVELSFRDLIELRFVQAFTGIGLDLRTIRACLEAARSAMGSDRPFSSGRFRTDGKRIFLELASGTDDPALLDLKNRQYVFSKIVEQTFKDLDLEDGLVARWRPYKGKESIVVDPQRSFGQPVAAAYGVPTIVLAEAVKAEGSVARVASLYEVDPSVVRDAIHFHEELAAA